jgi:hypothetical protein
MWYAGLAGETIDAVEIKNPSLGGPIYLDNRDGAGWDRALNPNAGRSVSQFPGAAVWPEEAVGPDIPDELEAEPAPDVVIPPELDAALGSSGASYAGGDLRADVEPHISKRPRTREEVVVS